MKRWTVAYVILVALCANAQAFWPFGGLTFDLFNKKMTQVEAQIADEFNAVKARDIDMRAELGVIKDTQITLQNTLNTSVQAALNAQANANVGYGTSQDQSAGHDLTNQVTNDSKVMLAYIKALSGMCMALISIVSLMMRSLMKTSAKSDFYMAQLLIRTNSNHEWEKILNLKNSVMRKKSILGRVASTKKEIIHTLRGD